MPVVIGGKTESSFADPSGLLGDCRRRIEAYLPILGPAAAEVQGGPMPDGQSTAWNTALRCFREAAAKIHRPGARAPLTRDGTLKAEHVYAGRAHDEMDRPGRLLLDDESLPPEQAARRCTVLGQLSELYRRHIPIEDGEAFPIAPAVLSEPDRNVAFVVLSAFALPTQYGHGSASGLLRPIAEGNLKTKPQTALDS